MDYTYAVRRLRDERTAYQTDGAVAIAARIDPANLSRFMQGKQSLSLSKIQRLAHTLNASLYELFLYAELAKDRERLNLHDIVRALSDNDVSTYAKVLRSAESVAHK